MTPRRSLSRTLAPVVFGRAFAGVSLFAIAEVEEMKSLYTKEQPRLLGFEPAAADEPKAVPAVALVAAGGPNSDLVGRTFTDRDERVVVTGVSRANPAHVVVRRERDGHSWTIPAGIVRMILPSARRRRAA